MKLLNELIDAVTDDMEPKASAYFYKTGWHHEPLSRDMAIDLYEAGASSQARLAEALKEAITFMETYGADAAYDLAKIRAILEGRAK